MKLSRPVIIMIIASSTLLLVCLLFFTYILPILNFMDNEIDDSVSGPGITLNSNELIDTAKLPQLPNQNLSPNPENNSNNNESNDNTSNEFIPIGVRTSNSIRNEIAPNSQNILLLGIDKAGNNCDTICIVNIDKTNKAIKLIMIPRDTYVPYGNEVVRKLEEAGRANDKGRYKLNATPAVGRIIGYSNSGKFKSSGMNFMHDILKTMYGVEFDNYMSIDFEGFIQIVNIMGGVDINVERDIRDSSGKIVFAKGLQHLQGNRALQYARHRYLYDANGKNIPTSGDYYRKENQLKMMIEMSKQMVTLDNIYKVGDIMYQLKNNVYHSISTDDLDMYKDIAIDFAKNKYQTNTVLIKGESIDPMGDKASYVLIK